MTQAITQTKGLTFEQYLLLPYNGQRTEFVDGEIIGVTEPSPRHVNIVEDLSDLLKAYIRNHSPHLMVRSANVGVQIPRTDRPDNSRDPDLLICTREQWAAMSNQTKALFLASNPPWLTIEVVSPSTIKKDTEDLVTEYGLAGISEYWVVNPIDETVSVYVLNGRAYTLKGKYSGEQPVESELLKHWNATAAEMLC